MTTPEDFLRWLEKFEATYPEIKIKRPTATRPTWKAGGTAYASSTDLWDDLSSRFPLEDLDPSQPVFVPRQRVAG